MSTVNKGVGSESFYGSTNGVLFTSEGRNWPRELNHPTSALFPVEKLKYLAQAHPDPESLRNFNHHLQTYQSNGKKTVELVSREALEKAKEHLLQVTHELDGVSEKLDNATSILKTTAFMSGIGAALIALGALGVYFTQTSTVPATGKSSQRNYSRMLSYASTVAGLALVIFSTYRLNASANHFNNFLESRKF